MTLVKVEIVSVPVIRADSVGANLPGGPNKIDVTFFCGRCIETAAFYGGNIYVLGLVQIGWRNARRNRARS